MNNQVDSMTNLANAPQNARAGSSGQSINRAQAEKALQAALDKGPEFIEAQIRWLLMLSASTPEQERADQGKAKPLMAATARLVALTNMVDTLSEAQAAELVSQVHRIRDAGARLHTLARLALRLPSPQYRSLVNTIWEQSSRINDPAVYARLMFKLVPLVTLIQDEPAASPALLQIVATAQGINNPEARIRSLITLAPHLPQRMSQRAIQRALDEIEHLSSDAQRCNALTTLANHLVPEAAMRALASAESIRTPADRARALTALARSFPPNLRSNLRLDALKSIAAIQDEEERADALIAFAPHLEYITDHEQFPALLERALGIAIGISRRPLRAQALVALAPHLTLDLQGEALAAVHSLNNERERAMLLAQLAPTLPPNMLVASLAVVHSMQTQDSRVHALTVLAHYAPDNAREQTILDALAAASNLSHHYERVVALVGLIEVLPLHLKEQALTNALETTRLITNENACARALNLLSPYLPARLVARALEIAQQLGNSEQRFTALIGLAPYLPHNQQSTTLSDLLRTASRLTLDYKRARALVDLVPLLPESLLDQALKQARTIEDPSDRVSVYIALARKLPPHQHRPVIAETWKLMKAIDSGYDAASALASLAPLLPSSAARDIAQAAGMIIGSIMDEYDQASAIAMLAPLLSLEENTSQANPSFPDRYTALTNSIHAVMHVTQQELRAQLLGEGAALWAEMGDSEQAYRLWCDVAMRLSHMPLADTLLCLGALTPVIQKLAGRDGLQRIAHLLEIR